MTWCEYISDGVWCGMWITEGDRCKRHKGKKAIKRIKIGSYSGFSQYRKDQGQFQAREGR